MKLVVSTFITKAPPKRPKRCNLCGGRVELISNDKIYGRKYGNGKAYQCRNCFAYVGCHNNGDALGILSDKRLKFEKIKAHTTFDYFWKHKLIDRNKEYAILADILGISVKLCHFGYFDMRMLVATQMVMKDPNWCLNKLGPEGAKVRLAKEFGVIE
ncbi:zinc-finger-containing protein [Lacticaseibacillus saniviri]